MSEWGLWIMYGKILGGNMGQLLIRVKVVTMDPTQQFQTVTDFHMLDCVEQAGITIYNLGMLQLKFLRRA